MVVVAVSLLLLQLLLDASAEARLAAPVMATAMKSDGRMVRA